MAKQIDWVNLAPSVDTIHEGDGYSAAQKLAALESVVGILHSDTAIDLDTIRDDRLARFD